MKFPLLLVCLLTATQVVATPAPPDPTPTPPDSSPPPDPQARGGNGAPGGGFANDDSDGCGWYSANSLCHNSDDPWDNDLRVPFTDPAAIFESNR